MKKNKIVDVRKAAKYYLKGYKVRRYITTEMFNEFNKLAELAGKRTSKENLWFNNWVWLSNEGKQFKSDNGVVTPFESLEKNVYNKKNLWEIKGKK